MSDTDKIIQFAERITPELLALGSKSILIEGVALLFLAVALLIPPILILTAMKHLGEDERDCVPIGAVTVLFFVVVAVITLFYGLSYTLAPESIFIREVLK